MDITRIVAAIAVVAFGAGFWTACTVDPFPVDSQFSCTTNQDCVATHMCADGVCTRAGEEPDCVDNDGDGYGVAPTGACRLCVEQGLCEEDCNDGDASINPGLRDTCDGKDNNCDGEVDAPIPCESASDCPDEQPYVRSCDDSGICIYKPLNQFGGPGCNEAVQCVDGERQTPGEECL